MRCGICGEIHEDRNTCRHCGTTLKAHEKLSHHAPDESFLCMNCIIKQREKNAKDN